MAPLDITKAPSSAPRPFLIALSKVVEELQAHKQKITLSLTIGTYPDDKRCRVLTCTGLMCTYGDIEDLRMMLYGKLARLCREHGVYLSIVCGTGVKTKIRRLWPSANIVVHSHTKGLDEYDVMLLWSCTISPF